MSIAEFPSNIGISGPVLDPGAGWTPPYDGGERAGRGGDRTPPQDNNAEQSVLGSMLLSKDAIADVIESVRGTDFYRPAHETIFDAVVDLYGRGEPADPVTVSAELQRRGELARIGGAPYLHTLSASVPIAANAGYYAEIVREKAILRRLVDAGTRIAQMGYSGEGQVDQVVDRAQAEVYGVTDRRTAEDYAPLSDIMESALDEIEAISSRDGGLVGVPTGFADLDELTNGLHGGQMVIVAARPAVGKALSLETALATPTGWTTMGEVRVGDQLFGADGLPTTVVAATDVMLDRPCYQVVFSDGSMITADAQHQWLTAKGDAEPAVATTEQIAASVEAGHAVVNTAPLQGRLAEHRVRAQLMDACDRRGEVGPEDGSITLTFPTAIQAECVHEWIVSLGYSCTRVSPVTLNFSTVDDVFGSYEKALLHKELRNVSTARAGSRLITEVRRVDSVPVRCVEVDNADHLYLAGESMIPTHNSTLGLDICRAASIHHNLASVIFSLEMTRNEITMRLLSAEAKIPLNHMRNGHMNDEDWAKLARKMGEVSSAPFFIDDSPNMTMMEIRAKARRLKQRHDLKLIVIDYLQLMTSGKRVESRQIEVSEFSRQIKLLAKELDVPIVALSQLNRGPEQRSDKRPMMSDLRESGAIEQDADMVILLHREDVYEKESTRPGEADLIVAKHRNGPTRDVTVAFQGHYSRFVDMAQG